MTGSCYRPCRKNRFVPSPHFAIRVQGVILHPHVHTPFKFAVFDRWQSLVLHPHVHTPFKFAVFDGSLYRRSRPDPFSLLRSKLR